jgi:excisionase family DNA binding protein
MIPQDRAGKVPRSTALSPAVIQAIGALIEATGQPQPSPSVRRAGGEPPLLTVPETARMLRVSEMTVRRAIADGDLPVVQFRRRYHVPRGFVEHLLASAEGGAQVVVEDYAAAWSAQLATATREVAAS